MQDDDDGNLASQVDVSRVEARNVVRSTAPAPAPKSSPAPAAAPALAPAVEPDPAPAAVSEALPVVRFSPKGGTGGVTLPDAQEPTEQIDEVQVHSHELVDGALTMQQMATGIKARSGGELAYPLFEEWAQAMGRGLPADWPLSKQKQALEWVEKGGWKTVRQWQARQQAAAERTQGEQVADAVDRLQVEDEVQGSEEGAGSTAKRRSARAAPRLRWRPLALLLLEVTMLSGALRERASAVRWHAIVVAGKALASCCEANGDRGSAAVTSSWPVGDVHNPRRSPSICWQTSRRTGGDQAGLEPRRPTRSAFHGTIINDARLAQLT
jgi:hypothetical protein